MCTQASFANTWRMPPQYASFDEAHPFPAKCPEPVGQDVDDENLLMYTVGELVQSPIERAARVPQLL